jgi:hypothetical protein
MALGADIPVGWAKRSEPTISHQKLLLPSRWARREARLCPPYVRANAGMTLEICRASAPHFSRNARISWSLSGLIR